MPPKSAPETASGTALRLADGSPLELPDLPSPQANALLHWLGQAKRGLPAATWKALCSDLAQFHAFCRREDYPTLPATPAALVDFVREQGLGLGKKPATIWRYLASLGRWHRIIEAPDPTRSELVKLELKALLKETADRPDQAEPLNWARLNRITEYFDQQQEASGRVDLAWLRDRTLLWLAHDLMARRNELVVLDVRDLRQDEHGSALIRRSKTDPDGRGATAFVADQTLHYAQTWMSLASIESGPLLRPVAKGGHVQAGRLTGRSVSRIFKARAKCLGLAYEDWSRISGHLARGLPPLHRHFGPSR